MRPANDLPETLIATHSGLRGRPGIDLTPAVVERVIRSFGVLLAERGVPSSIGLARDGRPGGQALADEVARCAAGAGMRVVDFGEISTPTAKVAARLRGLGGAIIVTGSHLGPEWNGLKLVAGTSYAPVDVRDLLLLPETVSGENGSMELDDLALSDHANALCSSVDGELIRAASLHVVSRGGVGPLGTIVLDRLGCARQDSACDLGLLLDADGDRLQLVDESGETLDPEVVLPLAALACDARHVVKGADTSRMVDEVLGACGGAVTVVSPGELHLVEELERTRADLAGEGNGGIVAPAIGPARDALAAGLLVLEFVARTGRPLSELTEALPSYARRRSTIPCGGADQAREALATLAGLLGVPSPEDPEAGIIFETDGGWALVRRSATEHVLRVTVEAQNRDAADALHAELLSILRLQPQTA
jgi:phosphomannomutase